MSQNEAIKSLALAVKQLDQKLDVHFDFIKAVQRETLATELKTSGLVAVICNMLGHWAAADDNPAEVIDLILEPLLKTNLRDNAESEELQHFQILRDEMHQMMRETALRVARSLK